MSDSIGPILVFAFDEDVIVSHPALPVEEGHGEGPLAVSPGNSQPGGLRIKNLEEKNRELTGILELVYGELASAREQNASVGIAT